MRSFGLVVPTLSLTAVVVGCTSDPGSWDAPIPSDSLTAPSAPGEGTPLATTGTSTDGSPQGSNPVIEPTTSVPNGSVNPSREGPSVVCPGPDSTGAPATGGTQNVPAGTSGNTGMPGGASGDGGSGPVGSGGGTVDSPPTTAYPETRRRVLFDDGWSFTKNDPGGASGLSYAEANPWALPTGNDFLSDGASRYERPPGNLGDGISYIAADFDDSGWRRLTLPHDYAIEGPFTNDVSANMGHLPATGVAWYRKRFDVPAHAEGKSLFVDFDGAMSYSLVWVNGEIVGGWPYAYSSFRLDVTSHIEPGAENVIAVRLDNPVPSGPNWDQGSSRWYPGAGIYRDVWLVTTNAVHVAQWGTFIRTPAVSESAASVELDVTVDNDSETAVTAVVQTDVYDVDENGNRTGEAIAVLDALSVEVPALGTATAATSGALSNPRLWGPPPTQVPNLYDAITTVTVGDELVDVYETRFGVRTFEYSPDQGLLVNGERIKVEGVCNHHDLGALGAVSNWRGKERQLELLLEMGANAVRTAHNPEDPMLYDLADSMGVLIMDEAFDVWANGKTAFDHHLFFDDWYEQDLRSMIRRDRNHPSIFIWSIGNEIPDQSDSGIGPTAQGIRVIANDEDPTRPTLTGMNSANPNSAFANAMEAIGLNYQGSGVRDAEPEYPDFHQAYPDRFLIGTETTDAYSSRGIYTFPVVGPDGEPASAGGGLTENAQVSSYDLYHADWSYVPDLEFEHQDAWNYVAGEFVWTGFDYLGEPDPHSGRGARSSYSGILDLAGFPKDRFYLYQANWRRDYPMVHVLPHWTWPGREGQQTPIMVYTTGDEAEVFVNGVSQGRKRKGATDYRLRWDDVRYEPGTVRVVAYKDGAEWATTNVETTTAAAAITLTPDRATIRGDSRDLSFVTATIVDAEGRLVPSATNEIEFSVEGSGELVATDNGNPVDWTIFAHPDRTAFSGLALAIVRSRPNESGQIGLRAASSGLTGAEVVITAQ